MSMPAGRTPVRGVIVLVVCAIVIPACTAAVAVQDAGWPIAVAGVVLAVGSALAARAWAPLLPADPGGSGVGGRALFLIWVGVGLFAAYGVGRLSVFMYDVTRSDHAFGPAIRPLSDPELAKPFFPQHNCFTCYIVAAHLAGERVANVYDRKYYRRAEVQTPIHRQIGDALHVDSYQYPPPFLILPRLLLATGGDFYQLRALWFALNVAVFVGGVLLLLLWIGGPVFGVHWLAIPLVLASPVMLGTLQIENVHLLIIMVSLLALPAFERRRHVVGGALLGFAIVSKLFPGLLLAFLILQRRWRSVGWTCAWMLGYGLAAVAWFGPRPFEAFFDFQLPRLASGEAFGFATAYVAPMVKNDSILGVAYKLEMLGVLSDPAAVARVVVWVYTAALVGVLALVGRRAYGWRGAEEADGSPVRRRMALARIWLVLLVLGQLRSPFLPWVYGNVPVLLLMFLLIPATVGSWGDRAKTMLALVGCAMLAVTLPLPFGPADVTPDVVFTLGASVVTLCVCALVVLDRRAGEHG